MNQAPTRNDLSSNEVKLDYQALLSTSTIAVGESLEQIGRFSRKVGDAVQKQDVTSIYLNAQWLEDYAKRLLLSADTLAALIGGKSRDNKVIVNV